jgi:hypothetical protein
MACSKFSYPSRADAIRGADRSNHVKLKPYVCPICAQYHLTSMSSAQRRSERKRLRLMKKMPLDELKECRKQAEKDRDEHHRARFDVITKT